jgi:hypothetical protein
MAVQLEELVISALLAETKSLPVDYRERMQTRPKRGHKERELDITGAQGSEFRLILRQSLFNALDFSVILAYRPPGTNQLFRLRRYNGKSHEHTNVLEGQTFYDFHVHVATERYQESGLREDAFAEPADRFADFQGAIRCLLTECGFDVPPDSQGKLFGEDF